MIGYANKPGKVDRLAAAGADLVITRMDLLPIATEVRRFAAHPPWFEQAGLFVMARSCGSLLLKLRRSLGRHG